MLLEEVLDALDYSHSPYYLKTAQKREPEVASLFRAAHSTGVDGIYVFQSSSEKNTTFSVQPAVYVAEAKTPEEAQLIHRNLWNLGQAPFLIVVLPNHIRVYTGFDYSRGDNRVGIVEPRVALDRNSILEQLADFCAEAINNGQLWHNRSNYLKPDKRVDKRLLKNLSKLGQFLREQMKLPPKIAHALIGKYVYIRYLRDRNILSDQWFKQHDIDIDTVLGRNATVNGLRHLCTILDDRFNGNIFPLDFDSDDAPKDEHVERVASIFKGDEQLPGGGQQLSLDFQVYDFAYIPIELLSSIYEQFLHIEGKGKKVGAYYTPEYLADYLISEMSSVMPLREGMKILDPACGSGVFLVLIYARLIEMRLAQSESSTLPLPDLLELLEHIYGIEREPDACYVSEFSLILMLLHYADVSEFLHDERFKLPSLHNTHIFQYDFFDDPSPVWTKSMVFDWIIGNPPWIEANHTEEPFAAAWIDTHRKQEPVDNNSIAEAFSWRVLRLLAPTGYIGLILPAALLYNLGAQQYRRSFFKECEVRRMTNFSNLRGELFEGRATAPAITMIYHRAVAEQEKLPIEHYGPFAINQITKSYGKLWTITINEHEYQTVSPYEAAQGDIATWKFALWGTHRDKRAIARLRKFFPQTLGQLCEEQNKEQDTWHLHQGSDLRNGMIGHNEKLEHVQYLVGKKRLDTTALNNSGYLFSVPDFALEDIPEDECFIREQGGDKGLLVSEPPHVIMNAAWKYSIYSDTYFVIKPRQIGLSAPPIEADRLRALSVFLSSSLVKYYLFFQAPQWGIERNRITLNTVRSIPIPSLTLEKVEQLAALQKELVSMELEQDAKYAQTYLDEQIIRILNVPESITTLVTEFLELRLKLVGGGTREAIQKAQQRPNQKVLQEYAQQLTSDLDGFLDSGKTHHRVVVERSRDLICCTVEFVRSDHAFTPVVKESSSQNGQMFSRLQQALKNEFSQWVYVQRGLKMFEPSSVSLYKVPQLINWTRTQAMNDADEMIAEILSTEKQHR